LATNLRNGARDFASAFTSGEGVAVTSRRQALLESAVRAFKTDAFQDDPAYARILAYRNRTVRAYNRQVRTALFGDTAPRFSPGEWLVARDSWFVEGIPLLTNSEEVRVVSTTQTKEDDEDVGRWTVWQLAIEGPEDVTPREITVLHESEEERYQERLARFRKEAKAGEQDWERYYRLREHFASVDYAYASTIHKAQGSTYHTCFLDVRDTHAAPERDRQPLLYVAATRPARRLAVLV
jgi:exodeoxyribonuclease-5